MRGRATLQGFVLAKAIERPIEEPVKEARRRLHHIATVVLSIMYSSEALHCIVPEAGRWPLMLLSRSTHFFGLMAATLSSCIAGLKSMSGEGVASYDMSDDCELFRRCRVFFFLLAGGASFVSSMMMACQVITAPLEYAMSDSTQQHIYGGLGFFALALMVPAFGQWRKADQLYNKSHLLYKKELGGDGGDLDDWDLDDWYRADVQAKLMDCNDRRGTVLAYTGMALFALVKMCEVDNTPSSCFLPILIVSTLLGYFSSRPTQSRHEYCDSNEFCGFKIGTVK